VLKLSIIIVSYNVRSYLRQCLKSIYRNTGVEQMEIIVVDNDSFDRTAEMVSSEFPQVILIQNSDNLGYAAAVNQGLADATGEMICLLNPDALVKQDTFSTLIEYMELNPEAGIVGCKVLDADGRLQLASRRNFPKPLVAIPKFLGLSKIFPSSKWFGQYNQTYMDQDMQQDVDAVSGACMMFRSGLIDEIGNLDERFFMFFEDTDFCFRAKQAGYRVVYNPATQIIHYKGESLKHHTREGTDIFHTAMLAFFRKHRKEFRPWWLFRILINIAVGTRWLFGLLDRNRTAFLSAIIDACVVVFSFTASIAFWYSFHYHVPVTFQLIAGHWELAAAYLIFWGIATGWLSIYRRNYLSYGRTLIAGLITFLLTSVLAYFLAFFAYSRAVLFISSVMIALLVTCWRIAVQIMHRYGLLKISHTSLLYTRKAIILGTDEESCRIGDLLVNSPSQDINVVGYVQDQPPEVLNEGRQFLGRTRDIDAIIKKYWINDIIIPESEYSIDNLIELIQGTSHLNVSFKFVSEGHHHLVGKGIVENIAGLPLVDIEFPLFDRLHLISKRVFDVILSSVMLIIFSPLHLYYWLTGRAYKQSIWVAQHHQMTIYRYQSSKLWIQELPYSFHILMGKMSFVGSQIVDYTEQDPQILFKPGLTGLSQLKQSPVSQQSVRSFDQFYIQNHTFILDLEILLKSLLRI